jgi:hypothetical protein
MWQQSVGCFDIETQCGTDVIVDKSKIEFKGQHAEGGPKGQLQFHFSKRDESNLDNCFGTESMTHEIYETLVRKVVKSSLGGINGNRHCFDWLSSS